MKYSNIFIAATLMAALVSFPSYAAKKGNNECPVGLVKDMTLDEEFGPGSQELTRCIKKRNQVKMVVQLNQFKDPNNQSNAYGLGNITNIIDDYEITHGMTRGRDYEIVVVLHGPGGKLALKDAGFDGTGAPVTGRNPYQAQVEGLMAKGVKFYFCQNTTRSYLSNNTLPLPSETVGGLGATGELIPGMLYSTAGLTSIADFEALGYEYIQP